MIIKDAKRISNSDKICRSYCDFYFGVPFLCKSSYEKWFVVVNSAVSAPTSSLRIRNLPAQVGCHAVI